MGDTTVFVLTATWSVKPKVVATFRTLEGAIRWAREDFSLPEITQDKWVSENYEIRKYGEIHD